MVKDGGFAVRLRDASFSWGKDKQSIIKDITLEVKKGQLVALVGSVGSGKTSLLCSILGELINNSETGSLITSGTLAYVSQDPWMQSTTIVDNITFGKGFQKTAYGQTIQSCALTNDLQTFVNGSLTKIGISQYQKFERCTKKYQKYFPGDGGIKLSGGQKQRIGLARAIYKDADIYILDGPLSAVDSRVGRHVFEKVIGPEGLLQKSTRIMVCKNYILLQYFS